MYLVKVELNTSPVVYKDLFWGFWKFSTRPMTDCAPCRCRCQQRLLRANSPLAELDANDVHFDHAAEFGGLDDTQGADAKTGVCVTV